MRIAFLASNRYQIFHYKWIAKEFPSVTILIELREQDFELTASFVRRHIPNAEVELVPQAALSSLDGRYDVIVCQTPILPLRFLRKTIVIAQQYSLAKERYQYGLWRAQATANLMYGEYSQAQVKPFATAFAVGNPLFDGFFQDGGRKAPLRTDGEESRILYMPTYGALSSLGVCVPALEDLGCPITVKLHHMEPPGLKDQLPPSFNVTLSDQDPVELLAASDCVISDYSGAAFDALYSGCGLVLVNDSGTNTPHHERLSDSEIDRGLLEPYAVLWSPGEPLAPAVSEAIAKIRAPGVYEEFVEKFYLNHGCAGEACAEKIREVYLRGDTRTFPQRQVQETLRRYIEENRRLRASLGGARQRAGEKRNRGSTLGTATLRRAARFARERLRRYPRLVLILKRARAEVQVRMGYFGKRQHSAAQVCAGTEVQPAARRAAVLKRILPLFEAEKVPFALHDLGDGRGSLCAVLEADRRAVFGAIKKLSSLEPELRVITLSGKRRLFSGPGSNLSYADVYSATWLKLGTPLSLKGLSVGQEGFQTILFVERAGDYWLARHTAAPKVDWTDAFSSSSSCSAYHVARSTQHVVPPYADNVGEVDLVYTWVDSNDPEWQRAHAKWSGVASSGLLSANNRERYENRDELKYSLRSVWLYAPFVRNIYIVTYGHVPDWLNTENERIRVVPHSDIFPSQEMLPTFNSHAIEACLHRIEGLSEYFIYLNDDMMFGREVTRADFFSRSGLLKIRLSPSQYVKDGRPKPDAIPTDWAAYNVRRLMVDRFAIDFDRKLMHTPYAAKKSIFREIEAMWPEEVDVTRRARFRSSDDIAIPSMLLPFYAIASRQGVEWPTVKGEYSYVDTGRYDCITRLKAVRAIRPKFLCLNATRYADIPLERQAGLVRGFLEDLFPVKSPFEK